MKPILVLNVELFHGWLNLEMSNGVFIKMGNVEKCLKPEKILWVLNQLNHILVSWYKAQYLKSHYCFIAHNPFFLIIKKNKDLHKQTRWVHSFVLMLFLVHRVLVEASGAPVLWRVSEEGFLRSSIVNGTTLFFLQATDGLVVPDHLLPLGQNYFLSKKTKRLF